MGVLEANQWRRETRKIEELQELQVIAFRIDVQEVDVVGCGEHVLECHAADGLGSKPDTRESAVQILPLPVA
jgi:hypothetical protein